MMAKMLHGRHLAVIMPAYNEAGNIECSVISVKQAIPEADVIVINDGSQDATATLARQVGALVLNLPHNLGIGGAVQTGYTFAVEQGYDLIARLDGDGQHDPAQLPTLLEPVLRGTADIVVGSRFVDMRRLETVEGLYIPFTRAAGIHFFAWLISLIMRQRVTDTTSGFQVCNAAVAGFLSRHCPSDYPEPEMLTALGRSGYRVHEVPVQMRKRQSGVSSITTARSAYYAIKVTLVLLLEVLRRPVERVATPLPVAVDAFGYRRSVETGVA